MAEELVERFARFELRGKRFDAPGMPASTAAEVGAFQEAIFAVARQLWLDSNPDRKRVSPGTLEEFELRLLSIEPGSARPVLQLHHSSSVSEETRAEWEPLLYQARDVTTSALRNISRRQKLPDAFPRSCIKAVSHIGRTLRDDEKGIIGSPEPGRRGASFDNSLRRTLQQIDEVLELSPAPNEVTVVGVVVEFDSKASSFRLSTDQGIVGVQLNEDSAAFRRVVRDACSLDGVVAPDVRVEGSAASIEPVRSLFDIIAVTVVRSVWEKKVAGRVDVLRTLQDGWSGPRSLAPSAEAIDALEGLTAELSAIDHPIRIGATTGGAVAFEWSNADFEFTAELNRDHQLSLFRDSLNEEEVLSFSHAYDPSLLVHFLETGVTP